MHLRRSAVETRDAVSPEPVVQVGVVAGPEERLGVAPDRIGIEVRDDSDLIVPADHREDASDRRISEAPAAANDGESTAMCSPGRALGGWTRSRAMRGIQAHRKRRAQLIYRALVETGRGSCRSLIRAMRVHYRDGTLGPADRHAAPVGPERASRSAPERDGNDLFMPGRLHYHRHDRHRVDDVSSRDNARCRRVRLARHFRSGPVLPGQVTPRRTLTYASSARSALPHARSKCG